MGMSIFVLRIRRETTTTRRKRHRCAIRRRDKLGSSMLSLLLLSLLVTSTNSFQPSCFSNQRHGSTFLQAEQVTTTTTTSNSRTWKQRPSPREKIPSIASNSDDSSVPPTPFSSSTRDESSWTRIKQEQDIEWQRQQRNDRSNNNNSWNRNTNSDVNGTGQKRRDDLNSSNGSVIKTTSNSISSTSSSSSLSRRQKTKPMPITGYDAQAIEAFYDRRPLQVGWRLNSLGFPMLGWYIRLLYDKAIGTFDNPLVQRKRGQELRNLLIQSKSVALIKSGQALSLRPDLIRNEIWAQELSKLVDAVGSFSDIEAMNIIKNELSDLYPRLAVTKSSWEKLAKQRFQTLQQQANANGRRRLSRLKKMIAKDDVLSLFEFYNDNKAVASASIGQVYKARLRRGPQLEAAIGVQQAAIWGDKIVAIKVQRPDVEASASLDMYLLRRTAMWASRVRGGDLPQVADAFGMQLFGELDYVREANNCDRFRELYGNWDDVLVPAACSALTRRRVLVMEWVDGEKGPWKGQEGIDTVRIGLRCSVDQLMNTGLFHADPHRGNLLRTPDGKLAFIDFGMMADIDEEERYGLFGLVIGLQNKDLPLVTENLLKLGFLKDTSQLDLLIPRLRAALLNSTGGTGKASDVNFAKLQAELDNISRENILRFATPPFFTIIIRSLTILEGVALTVDPGFKLVRGSYPYVLRQLLSPEEEERATPASLQKLLIRLLTVNGEQKEIEWERLRDFLRLAQKASKVYDPTVVETEDKAILSRQTIEMFASFLTSRTGIFLKKPLVHELAEVIDSGASNFEANLLRSGVLPTPLPGMNGPVNARRMEEMRLMVETFRDALVLDNGINGSFGDGHHGGSNSNSGGDNDRLTPAAATARIEAIVELFREASDFIGDARLRQQAGPMMEELRSVIQMVAVEVLEIRGARAMRNILNVK